MKQLQNNYTTPEQSKRLLELGVPADSADCYYENWHGGVQWRQFEDLKNSFFDDKIHIPCWSVGRLIEIYDTCVQSRFNSEVTWCSAEYVKNKLGKTYIEYLLNIFAVHIKDIGDLDFSKLEE